MYKLLIFISPSTEQTAGLVFEKKKKKIFFFPLEP